MSYVFLNSRFRICRAAAEQNKFKQVENILHVLLLNRRTCRTVLHGSMQNQAGPKNMCKETRETCAGTELEGGCREGVYLASRW
jgi:hypothetical protein